MVLRAGRAAQTKGDLHGSIHGIAFPHSAENIVRSREETSRTLQQDCRRATRDAEGHSGLGEEGCCRESASVCPCEQPRRGECPAHRRSSGGSATSLVFGASV